MADIYINLLITTTKIRPVMKKVMVEMMVVVVMMVVITDAIMLVLGIGHDLQAIGLLAGIAMMALPVIIRHNKTSSLNN